MQTLLASVVKVSGTVIRSQFAKQAVVFAASTVVGTVTGGLYQKHVIRTPEVISGS